MLTNHPITNECTIFLFYRTLGDEWSVRPEVTDDIEAFTCLMYGQAREKSVNAVRSTMLKKMVGEDELLTTKYRVDLSRLPPCRDNLVPHICRVNHRLANYKRADKPIFWHPNPYNPGRRPRRASLSQCSRMVLSFPLPSLTCWRKQLKR